MKLPPKGKACGSVALNVVFFPDHLQNVTHWVGVTSHELWHYTSVLVRLALAILTSLNFK